MEMPRPELVVEILEDADGPVVGRTRLQKIAYLMEAAGIGRAIPFEYRHYGPFSETLADSAKDAVLFGHIEEQRERAAWGGIYSIYEIGENPIEDLEDPLPQHEHEGLRKLFIESLREEDPVVLELVATAVFLNTEEGFEQAWDETKRRKPEKATPSRLRNSKALLAKLRKFATPNKLPQLA